MLDNPVMLATQAIRAAVIRLNAHPKDMPEVMDPAFPELLKALAAQGVAATGPVFSHFFKMTPDLFEFEVGVPVAVDVQPTGRVEPGQLPEATVMQTIYYGPYEGLPAAWGQFDQLVEEAGYQKLDEFWEEYIYGPESSPDPATWRTRLNRLVNGQG